MAKTFVVTALKNEKVPFLDRVYIGETIIYGINFSPWAEDNSSTLTTATWTVKSGTATISAQAFSSNAGQANAAFPNAGTVLIEVSATDTTLVKKIYISVLVVDPNTIETLNDYV